jgi:multicomponent Na+:H+ antiporter subunit G
MAEVFGLFFILIGVLFFLSGTIGLLRLPDIYTRLHALTKADNVGLGFIIIGLAIQATSWLEVVKLLLIWFLVLLASATSCHLVADAALRSNIAPWTKE